ncbi:MAG TPA: HPr family phosphocarrier protein [Ktedonobacteraceae bacterium]|nr:HPr family phosphocarrier protein [Ktedonobacteraceae bacterium]
MSVAENTVIITNKVGLHARPAALLVQNASRFQARIQVQHGERVANAKSIIGVLKLGAGQGATLVIQADGDDAEEAVKALVELVTRQFDEKEDGA